MVRSSVIRPTHGVGTLYTPNGLGRTSYKAKKVGELLGIWQAASGRWFICKQLCEYEGKLCVSYAVVPNYEDWMEQIEEERNCF